jgi:hypothetical protein
MSDRLIGHCRNIPCWHVSCFSLAQFWWQPVTCRGGRALSWLLMTMNPARAVVSMSLASFFGRTRSHQLARFPFSQGTAWCIQQILVAQIHSLCASQIPALLSTWGVCRQCSQDDGEPEASTLWPWMTTRAPVPAAGSGRSAFSPCCLAQSQVGVSRQSPVVPGCLWEHVLMLTGG